MKCLKITFFCFIVWKEILSTQSINSLEKPITENYFEGLVNYLKNESKLHQVMFILDDSQNGMDQMMNSVIKTVDKNFPSLAISCDQISLWLQRYYIYNITFNTII